MFIFRQSPTRVVELKEDNFGQEAYMEGFLIENINILARGENSEVRVLGRQISLEKRDRIDLLLMTLEDDKVGIRIAEIKKNLVARKALAQLERYMKVWKRQGSSILRREGLLKEMEDTAREWGKRLPLNPSDFCKHISGVLVAPDFKPALATSLSDKGNIYGLQMARYSSSRAPEAFVFVEHFPQISRTPISADKFWRGRNRAKRRTVDSILKAIRDKDPEITYKYWKEMISVYPNAEESEKGHPHRIASYVRGNKTFWIRKGVLIDLSKRNEIVKAVVRKKNEYMRG